MILGFYSAELNGEIIHKEIENETSLYYYDWRGILSDPDNKYLSIYDFKDTNGKTYYYFDIIAYKIDNRNKDKKRTATLSTGERHNSLNECLIDLIENYPYVRLYNQPPNVRRRNK